MKILFGIVCFCSAVVFLLPIGFWMFLHSYYGWVPEEATLLGMDLRMVLISISGFALLAFFVSLGLLIKELLTGGNRSGE